MRADALEALAALLPAGTALPYIAAVQFPVEYRGAAKRAARLPEAGKRSWAAVAQLVHYELEHVLTQFQHCTDCRSQTRTTVNSAPCVILAGTHCVRGHSRGQDTCKQGSRIRGSKLSWHASDPSSLLSCAMPGAMRTDRTQHASQQQQATCPLSHCTHAQSAMRGTSVLVPGSYAKAQVPYLQASEK